MCRKGPSPTGDKGRCCGGGEIHSRPLRRHCLNLYSTLIAQQRLRSTSTKLRNETLWSVVAGAGDG